MAETMASRKRASTPSMQICSPSSKAERWIWPPDRGEHSVRVHHLNCGSHCPLGGAIFDGVSQGVRADICTHCLLIESPAGLILVDTGYGMEDVRNHTARLPRLWPTFLNVRFRQEDTARNQIEQLGFSATDVRHIVLTHLDFDHCSGLSDFPDARVHVLRTEEAAAQRRRGFVARQRYRPALWANAADWRTYAPKGERWYGFEAVRQLDGLPPEILLVPLAGHTEGHAGVAVDTGTRWLLNAGDAFMHPGELSCSPPQMPIGLKVYQSLMDTHAAKRVENLARLRELHSVQHGHVAVFCSHDPLALADLMTCPRVFGPAIT
ncbi:MAG: MBL fold metallo-hydrolase [Hyphomicrobiaceae bacterium]|nr:MBL fold metallo-hydrolase [Hyphomicrobiaceae bacterium]